jgi:hypothetical protein
MFEGLNGAVRLAISVKNLIVMRVHALCFYFRYDDLQSTSDNIDLQSTILSRFDLIFVVRDIANTATDNRIAE